MLTTHICCYSVQVSKCSDKLETKANQQLVKEPYATTICVHLCSVTSFEAIQELKTMYRQLYKMFSKIYCI